MPATGAQVLIDFDGTAMVRTSAGRFLRLQAPPPGLWDVLTGASAGDEATAAYLAALQEEMTSREAADARHRWPVSRRTVGLLGSGAVIDELAQALGEWGVSTQRYATSAQLLATRHPGPEGEPVTGEGGSVAPVLVIAYADSPAERADWDRLDVLPGAGVAWLRAYREGGNCFVDPIGVTAEDPGSEQVRRRRLAASLVPGQLAAWQRAAPADGRPMPSSARIFLVGRILAVSLAWAQETALLEEYRQTLWKFVPATGTVSEHPVLGYAPPHVPDEPVIRR
ncbi:hypothetical protein [Prauserella flavalba]|uniref:hypothetical protein n=1 Tax=Prauserella flavalba TaxID=1477506 RepID=UPI001AEF76BC|nr:hypothetical protein [Prauserella flavalba]